MSEHAFASLNYTCNITLKYVAWAGFNLSEIINDVIKVVVEDLQKSKLLAP